MTALDLSALSPEVTLLGATTIVGPSAAVSSTAVTGFSDVATATIVVKVERVDNSNGEALSVTVQQSDDGNSWTTAAGPYSFTREGTQTLAVDAPADRMRVTYSAARGVREATIGSVTARLGVVDAPSVILTATVPLTDAQIRGLTVTPVEIIPAPGATEGFMLLCATLAWHVPVAYDASDVSLYLAAAGTPDLSGGDYFANFSPATALVPDATDPVSQGASFRATGSIAGLAMVLRATGTGLTDGGASNTLAVTVVYTVIDL